MRVITSSNFKKLAADYKIQPGFTGKDNDPSSQGRLLSKSVNSIPSTDDVKDKWERTTTDERGRRRKKRRKKPAKKFNPETDGFPKASL